MSARFFDAIAPRYDRVYARAAAELAQSLDRLLPLLAPRSRIADLGVGTGRELPRLLDAGHEVVGLDASERMLAECARRARRIALVRADLWERLPWDDGSFDAVIALHGTLAHAPTDAALAAFPAEVARVLRPSGVFVAEVPEPGWFEDLARDARGPAVWLGAGRGRFVDDATGERVDVRLPSRDEWQALFARDLPARVDDGGIGELVLVARRQPREGSAA